MMNRTKRHLRALMAGLTAVSLVLGACASVALAESDAAGVTVRVCAPEFPGSQCSPIGTESASIWMRGPLPDGPVLDGALSLTHYFVVFNEILPGRYFVGGSGLESVEVEVESQDLSVHLRFASAVPTPTAPPASCNGDFNDDGQVTVDEILTVVSEALEGCPGD